MTFPTGSEGEAATTTAAATMGADAEAGPRLELDEPSDAGSRGIRVRWCDPEFLEALGTGGTGSNHLRSMLRVSLLADGERLDLSGAHVATDDGIHFLPRFPFDPDVPYLATFDPAAARLSRATFPQSLAFSLVEESVHGSRVVAVFPSANELPENLLRFYVDFAGPMVRGTTREAIRIVGPDDETISDILYRAPVELWDRGMQRLTVLLDPGRLKRGVGPNRTLGAPLRVGAEYTLVIGPGMRASNGAVLEKPLRKRFRVIDAVRERIDIGSWRIVQPRTNTRQPLKIDFPRPLDRGLLVHALAVVTTGDAKRVVGRVSTEDRERRWVFTPASSWEEGDYRIEVSSALEDVCGNRVTAAFDGPFGASVTSCPPDVGRAIELTFSPGLDKDETANHGTTSA